MVRLKVQRRTRERMPQRPRSTTQTPRVTANCAPTASHSRHPCRSRCLCGLFNGLFDGGYTAARRPPTRHLYFCSLLFELAEDAVIEVCISPPLAQPLVCGAQRASLGGQLLGARCVSRPVIRVCKVARLNGIDVIIAVHGLVMEGRGWDLLCLLYTSDAADE